jgi:hypothetical protein
VNQIHEIESLAATVYIDDMLAMSDIGYGLNATDSTKNACMHMKNKLKIIKFTNRESKSIRGQPA